MPNSLPHPLGTPFILALCLLTGGARAGAADPLPDAIAPFFTQHCVRCHGAESAEGDFRTDQLHTNFNDLAMKSHWSEVVNVLNSHEMPPESEPQPDPQHVAQLVDWITDRMVAAEAERRESAIVLRRLNRTEYANTMRDLFGVPIDVSAFPEDPSAAGFDNNGAALTLSPLQMELYFQAARRTLDQVMVRGEQPPKLLWRIEPESGDGDHNRVEYDGQRVIVNGGKNRVQDGYKVMHHESWDRNINFRSFALPHPGRYIIRIKAAGNVPARDEVVRSAETFLRDRMQRDNEKRPERERYHREAYEQTLEHFRTDPVYDYGPPRLKLIRSLGGQPEVVAEFDVPASLDQPAVYETEVDFTTESAGVKIEYAYSLPRLLENFWFQSYDSFARPELWVDWIELEGPIYDQWPPASHRQLLQTDRSELTFATPNQRRQHAKAILETFLPRAYRRPVTAAEVAAKLALFDQADTHNQAGKPDKPFQDAIAHPLIATLLSPNFLYLAEIPESQTPVTNTQPTASNDTIQLRGQLDPHELANRLAYFLWSSMPDDTLRLRAATGQLSDPQVLTQEVDRMLADPKSRAFVENFAGQWLGIRQVGANPPAADLFPRYDRHLEQSITEEALAFFAEVLTHDLDAMNLVASDFVVINERLARYYGITGVRGDHFRRVTVPAGVHRGGIVTQAAMLTITSNGTRTSPVKRGTWIMKNVLGMDPGLPVANAGDIAPKVPGIDKATVRQRLEIHRESPQCARCHNKIDPLGFALENFDASGRWRLQEGFGYKGRVGKNDPLIDASAKMIDGTEFTGVDGLQQVLRERETLFLECLSQKMLTYALGRELGVADRALVDQAVSHMQSHDRSLRSLIQWIAHSPAFQQK